jgi:hypothetical protein
MNTANIIMAACLIILMGVAVWLIIRYLRKTSEVEIKENELKMKDDILQKNFATLDRSWKKFSKEKEEWKAARHHIYANFEVLDSQDPKPTMKSIQKSLSSKIGYAMRREFPSIQTRHDEKNGGRTVYSIDFFVSDYEETV